MRVSIGRLLPSNRAHVRVRASLLVYVCVGARGCTCTVLTSACMSYVTQRYVNVLVCMLFIVCHAGGCGCGCACACVCVCSVSHLGC